jgi:hypothetical protein
MKKLVYLLIIAVLSQSLVACVPVLIGASAGAAGGYVYSKNAPYHSSGN